MQKKHFILHGYIQPYENMKTYFFFRKGKTPATKDKIKYPLPPRL